MAKLLKLSELAELTGVPLVTLRYWARLRWFPVVQMGRMYLADPDEFARALDARTNGSKDHASQGH